MNKMKLVRNIMIALLLGLFFGTGLAAAPRVVDQAGLLSAREAQELLRNLDAVAAKYNNCDVVIVTLPSLQGNTAEAVADDFFDYQGYGIGAERSGILFLICPQERDWAISTRGYGIKAFTDWGIDQIFEKMRKNLSNDNYYGAFTTYASECDRYLAAAAKGKPIDKDNTFMSGIISLVAGLIAALGGTTGMKSQLKSIRRQGAAQNYVQTDSLSLAAQNALYLFSNVSRTPIPKSGSSGGGGSSTHVGSSGATHGGRSGKY
ncbi:MAG: TPM domain-containing protein [Fusobacteriaceae bacterium]|jgi:uncharacterized protein|nr:TPM domain-containing protein [Fusobacteriaceae bacterium]